MTTKLTSDQLKTRVSLDFMAFDSTDQLQADIGFLGHDRAKSALEFGINMPSTGYNLFVMGEPGTGRQTLVSRYVKEKAEKKNAPSDWCFVNNFAKPSDPIIIELPANQSQRLVKDMERFVDELQDTFPATFENPSYQRKRAQIESDLKRKYDDAIAIVDRHAGSVGVVMIGEAGTIMFSVLHEGKAIEDTDFAQLPETLKVDYLGRISSLEAMLNEQLLELPQWRREASEKHRALNLESISQAIKPMLKELERQWANQIQVLRFIRDIRTHIPRVILDIFGDDPQMDNMSDIERRQLLSNQYLPNVMVQHQISGGAPVEYELMPTYQNLFGRIEYSMVQGTPITHYRLIKPGSLLRANGGFLILDAEKLLIEPYAWESLKLALKTKSIKLESPHSEPTLYSSVSINPQSVPLNLKIILIGSRDIYYQLQAYDPEFSELFRVLVDFDSYIPRTEETLGHLIRRLAHYSQSKGFAPMSRDAVERLIEYSLRQSEHKARLSPRMVSLFEVIAEADFIRSDTDDTLITQVHIKQALQAAEYRHGRISEQVMQEISEGTVLIDTQGEKVGQINGLTVIELGETRFGQPARITATVYSGSNGILDIEKEVELGQSIHSKGVLLLNGYMGQKYAKEFPLIMSANIAMEQSYGYIDGDSASLAELIALLSAIADVPVDQGFAVTGSINQYGEVQAIGGVNEKIEGFFKLCQERGLTGHQGVIIPQDNVQHLMIDDEVIAAVDAGTFAIHAVSRVEQAVGILLGENVGEADEYNRYPQDSINGLVWQRLKMMSEYDREG